MVRPSQSLDCVYHHVALYILYDDPNSCPSLTQLSVNPLYLQPLNTPFTFLLQPQPGSPLRTLLPLQPLQRATIFSPTPVLLLGLNLAISNNYTLPMYFRSDCSCPYPSHPLATPPSSTFKMNPEPNYFLPPLPALWSKTPSSFAWVDDCNWPL